MTPRTGQDARPISLIQPRELQLCLKLIVDDLYS